MSGLAVGQDESIRLRREGRDGQSVHWSVPTEWDRSSGSAWPGGGTPLSFPLVAFVGLVTDNRLIASVY